MTSSPANQIEPIEGCLQITLNVLGNKWTALMLRELSEGPKRFTQLERQLDGISPRTLSQRLDELVHCDIVTKKSFAETPPRVEYTLTQKGLDLVPVLQGMAAWGQKYLPKDFEGTDICA